MARNDFTFEEALQAILRRLRANESDGIKRLADEIEIIIDKGTLDNVDQAIESQVFKKTKKVLKARSLTDQEALEVASNFLRAYFLDLPMIVASIEAEFAEAGFSSDDDVEYGSKIAIDMTSIGKPKTIAIELETETTRFREGRAIANLPEVNEDLIQSQKKNFALLQRLIEIEGE
jgi:hypothetical protein